MPDSRPLSEQFGDRGYVGPIRVLSVPECKRLLSDLNSRPPQPLAWEKGSAPVSRALFEVGTRLEILDVLVELLGKDVLLWGASLQARRPGAVHHWHCDIESCAPDARTVSVWLGLEDTTPESSLIVLPGSHVFGETVQEARRELGMAREEATADALATWARKRHGRGDAVVAGARDGEAIFFDGRLWHGTHNVGERTRVALLLQYAAPSTPIRIPDLSFHDWPFRKLEVPRPPCLVVNGSATADVNHIVPAPVAEIPHDIQLTSRIHPLRLPLELDEAAGWKPYQAFRGTTANLPWIKCHASVLPPGHSPHPPHAHDEEEILVLLSGEAELEFSDGETAVLTPGQLAYYPAGLRHTLRATGAAPAMYVMLKWRGSHERAPDEQGSRGRYDTAGPRRRLFEHPTRWLRKLHCHTTVLEPNDGYEPHADAYDVAIVVLEGEVETMGGRAVPHDVIFYVAGEEHGMRSVGEVPARYVVFELLGAPSSTEAEAAPTGASVIPSVRRRLSALGRH